ncbi:MAG: glycine cleavage system protein GcvH [Rhodospirillales bacterium]|nr:glycine cleavage system protein GcvH [Rhodospirillales bacterium]
MLPVRFTREHEWVRVEDGVGTIGITDFAQGQLGDVVFVELPAIDTEIARGVQAAVVESVKAASEVYAPVSGTVIAINDSLADEPGQVNGDPQGAGWFFKVRLSDPSELDGLMDQAAYEAFLRSLD